MKWLTISSGVHDISDLGGMFLDVAFEFRRQRGIAGRDAIVRCALKNSEMGGRLGDHWRGLDTGGAGADLTDSFAGEIHPFMRPLSSVVPASGETLEPRNFRHIRRRQTTDGGNQELRGEL